MEVTRLPYGQWRDALQHARNYELQRKLYPGDDGKLIEHIDMDYPGDGRAEFVITFEDGTQWKFAAGEGD